MLTSSAGDHIWMSIWIHCLQVFQTSLSTYFFPQFLVTHFPIVFLPENITIPPNHWPQHRYQLYNCISSSKHSEHTGALLKILFAVIISVHQCPSGMSQTGVVGLHSSTLGGIYIPCRSICKASQSLVFLCQLIITAPSESISGGWNRDGSRNGDLGPLSVLHVNVCASRA